MRIAVTAITLLFALAACSTTDGTVTPYQQPNSLMGAEITQRIDQIAFQHREELVQNLLWLSQTGEQTIPALLRGLNSDNPKVRSSCCWVLGRLRDRRTVNDLRQLVSDSETSVRLEAARALVLMGDLEQSPKLIEGLDSDRKEVRYMCHEALKSATGHDFGYDHLNSDQRDLQLAGGVNTLATPSSRPVTSRSMASTASLRRAAKPIPTANPPPSSHSPAGSRRTTRPTPATPAPKPTRPAQAALRR